MSDRKREASQRIELEALRDENKLLGMQIDEMRRRLEIIREALQQMEQYTEEAKCWHSR